MQQKEMKKNIDKLDYFELRKLAGDLESGSLRRHIYEKIKKYEEGKKICVNCGTNLGSRKFSLVFEQDGMKKTAEFCAIDCLEYFIANMKHVIRVK